MTSQPGTIVGIRADLINALIGDTTPATDGLIKSLADSVRDRREHEHNRGAEDLFCGNLSGWAGERMAPVLRRLLDAEAEMDRLRAELEQRLGELLFWHFEYQAAMDNYLGENQQLRQELADTAMMRDFNQRSADHIAAKRDLAEAAIAAWDRDEISGDAAVLMIRKALADGPAPAAPDAT